MITQDLVNYILRTGQKGYKDMDDGLRISDEMTRLVEELINQEVVRRIAERMPSEEEVLRYFNNHFDCYADADHIEIAMTNTAVLKLIWWFRSRMSEPNNEGGDK